jgi:hypothetical protein
MEVGIYGTEPGVPPPMEKSESPGPYLDMSDTPIGVTGGVRILGKRVPAKAVGCALLCTLAGFFCGWLSHGDSAPPSVPPPVPAPTSPGPPPPPHTGADHTPTVSPGSPTSAAQVAVPGCTYAVADNFNSAANLDDGSCIPEVTCLRTYSACDSNCLRATTSTVKVTANEFAVCYTATAGSTPDCTKNADGSPYDGTPASGGSACNPAPSCAPGEDQCTECVTELSGVIDNWVPGTTGCLVYVDADKDELKDPASSEEWAGVDPTTGTFTIQMRADDGSGGPECSTGNERIVLATVSDNYGNTVCQRGLWVRAGPKVPKPCPGTYSYGCHYRYSVISMASMLDSIVEEALLNSNNLQAPPCTVANPCIPSFGTPPCNPLDGDAAHAPCGSDVATECRCQAQIITNSAIGQPAGKDPRREQNDDGYKTFALVVENLVTALSEVSKAPRCLTATTDCSTGGTGAGTIVTKCQPKKVLQWVMRNVAREALYVTLRETIPGPSPAPNVPGPSVIFTKRIDFDDGGTVAGLLNGATEGQAYDLSECSNAMCSQVCYNGASSLTNPDFNEGTVPMVTAQHGGKYAIGALVPEVCKLNRNVHTIFVTDLAAVTRLDATRQAVLVGINSQLNYDSPGNALGTNQCQQVTTHDRAKDTSPFCQSSGQLNQPCCWQSGGGGAAGCVDGLSRHRCICVDDTYSPTDGCRAAQACSLGIGRTENLNRIPSLSSIAATSLFTNSGGVCQVLSPLAQVYHTTMAIPAPPPAPSPPGPLAANAFRTDAQNNAANCGCSNNPSASCIARCLAPCRFYHCRSSDIAGTSSCLSRATPALNRGTRTLGPPNASPNTNAPVGGVGSSKDGVIVPTPYTSWSTAVSPLPQPSDLLVSYPGHMGHLVPQTNWEASPTSGVCPFMSTRADATSMNSLTTLVPFIQMQLSQSAAEAVGTLKTAFQLANDVDVYDYQRLFGSNKDACGTRNPVMIGIMTLDLLVDASLITQVHTSQRPRSAAAIWKEIADMTTATGGVTRFRVATSLATTLVAAGTSTRISTTVSRMVATQMQTIEAANLCDSTVIGNLAQDNQCLLRSLEKYKTAAASTTTSSRAGPVCLRANPCHNHGVCVDRVDRTACSAATAITTTAGTTIRSSWDNTYAAVCECTNGFSGQTCADDSRPVDSRTCTVNADCDSSTGARDGLCNTVKGLCLATSIAGRMYGSKPKPQCQVYADVNGNGHKDAGEPATVTDSQGLYTISIAPRTTTVGTDTVLRSVPSASCPELATRVDSCAMSMLTTIANGVYASGRQNGVSQDVVNQITTATSLDLNPTVDVYQQCVDPYNRLSSGACDSNCVKMERLMLQMELVLTVAEQVGKPKSAATVDVAMMAHWTAQAINNQLQLADSSALETALLVVADTQGCCTSAASTTPGATNTPGCVTSHPTTGATNTAACACQDGASGWEQLPYTLGQPAGCTGSGCTSSAIYHPTPSACSSAEMVRIANFMQRKVTAMGTAAVGNPAAVDTLIGSMTTTLNLIKNDPDDCQAVTNKHPAHTCRNGATCIDEIYDPDLENLATCMVASCTMVQPQNPTTWYNSARTSFGYEPYSCNCNGTAFSGAHCEIGATGHQTTTGRVISSACRDPTPGAPWGNSFGTMQSRCSHTYTGCSVFADVDGDGVYTSGVDPHAAVTSSATSTNQYTITALGSTMLQEGMNVYLGETPSTTWSSSIERDRCSQLLVSKVGANGATMAMSALTTLAVLWSATNTGPNFGSATAIYPANTSVAQVLAPSTFPTADLEARSTSCESSADCKTQAVLTRQIETIVYAAVITRTYSFGSTRRTAESAAYGKLVQRLAAGSLAFTGGTIGGVVSAHLGAAPFKSNAANSVVTSVNTWLASTATQVSAHQDHIYDGMGGSTTGLNPLRSLCDYCDSTATCATTQCSSAHTASCTSSLTGPLCTCNHGWTGSTCSNAQVVVLPSVYGHVSNPYKPDDFQECTVYIDVNGNQRKDSGDYTALVDAAGNYHFSAATMTTASNAGVTSFTRVRMHASTIWAGSTTRASQSKRDCPMMETIVGGTAVVPGSSTVSGQYRGHSATNRISMSDFTTLQVKPYTRHPPVDPSTVLPNAYGDWPSKVKTAMGAPTSVSACTELLYYCTWHAVIGVVACPACLRRRLN